MALEKLRSTTRLFRVFRPLHEMFDPDIIRHREASEFLRTSTSIGTNIFLLTSGAAAGFILNFFSTTGPVAPTCILLTQGLSLALFAFSFLCAAFSKVVSFSIEFLNKEPSPDLSNIEEKRIQAVSLLLNTYKALLYSLIIASLLLIVVVFWIVAGGLR